MSDSVLSTTNKPTKKSSTKLSGMMFHQEMLEETNAEATGDPEDTL
jgi:hypothetical protein